MTSDFYSQEKFVNVDGIRTRYYDLGQGSPVLLIHGGQPGSYVSADDWSLNIGPLSEHHRTIALDKLGQGLTGNPKSVDDYTLTAIASHVRRFVQLLDLEQLTVVGHSRGALPAVMLALSETERLSCLIVLDTNTITPHDPSSPVDFYSRLETDAPKQPNEASVRKEPVMNSFSSDHITHRFTSKRLEVATLEKTRKAKMSMEQLFDVQFRPDHLRLSEQTLERLKTAEVKVPALVVWGYNDPSAPVVLAYRLFDIFNAAASQVELHIFNESGHYPHREHAGAFNSLLVDFVRRSIG